MKKQWIRLLLAGLLLLSACGQKEAEPRTAWTREQIAWELAEEGNTLPLTAVEDVPAYLRDYYGIESGVTGGTVLCAGGASAQEIAVLQLEEAGDVLSRLQAYLQRRQGDFAGYLPEEEALLERAGTALQGDVAVLFVCPEPEEAAEAFQRVFTEEPPEELPELARPPEKEEPVSQEPLEERPEPPEEEAPPETGEPPDPLPESPWEYDAARLLDAWEAGDWSGLPQRDQEILAVCQEALAQTEGLSPPEAERVLHDWMLAWGHYDTNRLANLPDYEENPDNENPYGFLIGRVGICRGYTATFQLLMDLAGIPCISVEGTANTGREEHAWNLVQLEGEWYAVDVTWNDPTTINPVQEYQAHRYYNVTRDFLRDTYHYWDETSVPEATGKTYAYRPQGS